MQVVKSGRGGFRQGAGRKPTGNAATVPVRVDARLLPFLNVVRARGVDSDLLTKIEAWIAPVNLQEDPTKLCGIPDKNRSRDVNNQTKNTQQVN